MNSTYETAMGKLKDFVDDAVKHGWKLKAVRFSFMQGIAKYGVDIQNEEGKILQFNANC